MAESVYKMIELVGTSTESWEKAAAARASAKPEPVPRYLSTFLNSLLPELISAETLLASGPAGFY